MKKFTEYLAETSKDKLGKYLKSAIRDTHELSMDRGALHATDGVEDEATTRRLNNRAKGQRRAIDKLVKK